MQPPPEMDYGALLDFRLALRRFNHWSELQAKEVGLTHAQHQLLLAVKGHRGSQAPTIGDVANYLMLRHHSAVELVNRAQAGDLIERHRDTADGRIVRLTLTDKGEDCLNQLTALHLAELHQLAPLLQHVIDDSSHLEHGPLG
jgi:DNA-binding MarR family transcriptional regulator